MLSSIGCADWSAVVHDMLISAMSANGAHAQTAM
jgi:hypothetical protein